ncbi:MAG: Release factor glutamine methyltransferase [bacterium]|nr:Release factor glutamine methyltransferase [bacterium]
MDWTVGTKRLDISRGDWVRSAASRLAEIRVESPRLSAELLLAFALGVSRSQLLIHPDVVLTPDEIEIAEGLLARRARHEPVAYILGFKEFRNLSLRVTPAVLIPRPETEEIPDLASSLQPSARRILDAGTGSGCIALSLVELYPEARILGCDVSGEALGVSVANDARRRVGWVCSNWLEAFAEHSLDLVVSNPPYLTDEEMDSLDPQIALHEPAGALRGGVDGLDAYRTLLPQAYRCLSPGGQVLVEGSPTVAAGVVALLGEAGFVGTQIHRDLAGKERFLSGRRPSERSPGVIR